MRFPDHPIIVDDAILTLFCEKHVGKSPLEADIPTSDSPTLFLTSPILITNHALHALQRKFGVQLRKLWSLKVVPDSRAWHWDRHLVRQIGKDMEDHIQHHIPPEARWNPDAVDEAELIYTSRLEWSVFDHTTRSCGVQKVTNSSISINIPSISSL